MAVNIDGGNAEVRVGTLNIRADRVQADLRADETLNLANHPRQNERLAQSTGRGTGRGSGEREGRPPSRSAFSKLQSRCFFSFMIVPFAVVLALIALGIATFVVKNHQAKQHCSTTCSLVCGNQSLLSFSEDCTIAYISGGLAALVAVTFILTLLVRVCGGSKM